MPVVTITTDWDQESWYTEEDVTYTCNSNDDFNQLGYFSQVVDKTEKHYHFRSGIRFALTDLPSGKTVTKVRTKVNVSRAGGAAHLTDIHAYGTNGQEQPEGEVCQTFYNRCASGNLYVDDSDALRTAGQKWFTLGDGASAQACIDVANAKSAVNRFSVGFHEEGDDDYYAAMDSLELSGGIPAQLEITYEEVVPVVWSGDTHQIQMAKAILGLYLPWSKRFPNVVPRMF